MKYGQDGKTKLIGYTPERISSHMTYEYDAELVRVIDGDSVVLKVSKTFDFGFKVKERKTFEDNFRLYGIDTPELRGSKAQPEIANAAKDRLAELLLQGPLRVVTYKPGKYGRWLIDLYVEIGDEEIHVNKRLLEEGHAKPYGA